MKSMRRDPATDPGATVADFVYRLRRMGYPGNVRVEFPIYTVEDVRWCARLMEKATRDLLACAGDSARQPLGRVLEARALVVALDREMRRRMNATATSRLTTRYGGAGNAAD